MLPWQYANSCQLELFCSTLDGSVAVAEMIPSTSFNNGFTDLNFCSAIGSSGGLGPPSPIVSMSFTPNGQFLACFTANSVLTVVSTNFVSKVLQFDARLGSLPPLRSMGWCCEDSILLHWKKLGILMVGPYGDFLRFPFDNDIDSGINTGLGIDGSQVAGTRSVGRSEIYLVP